MVIFAIDHRLEALDRVFQLDELAGDAGEHFGHVEGLRQEALDLAGAADGELVILGQLVHAEDRDAVLKRLVLLPDRLHRTRPPLTSPTHGARPLLPAGRTP